MHPVTDKLKKPMGNFSPCPRAYVGVYILLGSPAKESLGRLSVPLGSWRLQTSGQSLTCHMGGCFLKIVTMNTLPSEQDTQAWCFCTCEPGDNAWRWALPSPLSRRGDQGSRLVRELALVAGPESASRSVCPHTEAQGPQETHPPVQTERWLLWGHGHFGGCATC